MAYILEAKNINKTFGQAKVLDQVSFQLRPKEIHALIGENGAGKSTLIKIISGVYTKDSGEIYSDGEQVHINSPKDAIDHGIRVIHQEINMVPALSVAENIYLGQYPKTKLGRIDWNRMETEAEALLRRLGVSFSAKERAGKLTIAQQQIVEIAKALSINPKVLIMDEPTAALNDQETDALFEIIRNLKEQGVSIIYITHRFAELYKLVDRVTVLRDGKNVDTVDIGEVTDDRLVRMMVSSDTASVFTKGEHVIGEELFRLENLCAGKAFQNINLSVHRGEQVVIFGLAGAGQTELCRAVFGDLPISDGRMLLRGEPIEVRSIKDACQKGIGYVTDDRKNEGIIPQQSVQENICLVAYDQMINGIGVLNRKKVKAVAQKYFTMLKIHCKSITQTISSLSGGNQQKGMFCRWLANDVKVLLLNMPTRGVDVGARAEIYRTMEAISRDGCAIITVSLEIPEVLSIADTVYVMHEGRICARLCGEEITQENLMKGALGVSNVA